MLLALIALASGCASQSPLTADMSAWQGDDISVALAIWGAPEDERASGDETILVWRDRASAHSPSGRLGEPAEGAIVCERMLAVADDGTITGWRWRGNACESISPAARDRTLAASR
jgi:hypothetical protein